MSDDEFDRYLAILQGLLRLDASHRGDIAAELRDHLEERHSALLAKGYSRDQATLIALEEFGDAAGLAGEFLQIFRKRRRRWVMRLTVGSVAACMVIGLTVLAFWPDAGRAPLISAVAQEKAQPAAATPKDPALPKAAAPGGAAADPFGRPAGTLPGTGQQGAAARAVDPFAADQTPTAKKGDDEPTSDDYNAATERKLAQRKAANYRGGVLLQDVLNDIAQRYDVEIYIHRKKVEESGTALDVTVDLELKQVRGDLLLDLVLRDAQLIYTIRDGIVMVTTEADLQSTVEVRVYNCLDMPGVMHFGGGFGAGAMPGGSFGDASGTGFGTGGFPGAAAGGGPPGAMGGAGMAGGMSGMAPGGMAMPGMPGMGMMAAGMGGEMGAGMGVSGNANVMTSLINVITATVAPETWVVAELGGTGTIEAYSGGLLIVNQNPHVHRKVEKLLQMMREAAKQKPGAVVREK